MRKLLRHLRKLSEARQEKLDRLHIRDCPGWRNWEFSCSKCDEIHRRRAEAKEKPT